MVELALFLKALLLGVAVAAPLGPIGALCINRTLERGFFAGVAGGIGTSLADGLVCQPRRDRFRRVFRVPRPD